MQTTPQSAPSSDVFHSSVTQLAKTAQKQKKLVFIGSTIIVLVLAAVSLYLTKKNARLDAGRNAFFHARTTLDDELKAVKSSLPKEAPPKVDPKSKAPAPAPVEPSLDFEAFPVQAKLSQSIPQLEKVGTDYTGSLPGYEAWMLLGRTFLEHGASNEERGKAATYFEKAAHSAPAQNDAVAAYQSMAFAQEAQGQYAEAAKTFDRVLNYGSTPFQADAMKGLARNYELQKDLGNARMAYERIVSTFPSTEDARFAQMKLAGLPGGAPSAAPAKTPEKK